MDYFTESNHTRLASDYWLEENGRVHFFVFLRVVLLCKNRDILVIRSGTFSYGHRYLLLSQDGSPVNSARMNCNNICPNGLLQMSRVVHFEVLD